MTEDTAPVLVRYRTVYLLVDPVVWFTVPLALIIERGGEIVALPVTVEDCGAARGPGPTLTLPPPWATYAREYPEKVAGWAFDAPPRFTNNLVWYGPVREFDTSSGLDPVDWFTTVLHARREHASTAQPPVAPKPANCCWKCGFSRGIMLLCPICGNKRCPHASDHELPCTSSNEPGQPGSIY